MKRAPFLTFAVAAFLAFIVAPLVGIVVLELRAERARERREIEAAARLKLLAEQQRLREAGAWLASAGGDEQTGGAYWRLARVLKDYLEPRLDEQEGKEHADFIRKNHGVIVKS